MNIIRFLVIANGIMIPFVIIFVPYFFNYTDEKFNVDTWSEEAQKEVQKSNERWATIMYIVPLTITNILAVFLIMLHNMKFKEEEKL